jgi:hypothetical protein
MATYPLLFGFRDVVAGAGFWAGVAVDGRALLVEDEEGAWFYGVEPGGIAGHGATAQEAHQDFRAGYRSVLSDLADEATSFEDFQRLAHGFLSTVNRPNEAQWREAVERVRAGEVNLDWLPQRSADKPRRHKVKELEEPRGAVNDPENQSPFQSLAA